LQFFEIDILERACSHKAPLKIWRPPVQKLGQKLSF